MHKAINKTTECEVGIKIMNKKAMKTEDIELFRREIEILKISQHPNIIRLLDVFETAEFIFIGKTCTYKI